MQIGDDFYEDLTPETTVKVLDALGQGKKPKPGPQSGRHTSENSAGMTALTSKVGSISSVRRCCNADVGILLSLMDQESFARKSFGRGGECDEKHTRLIFSSLSCENH